jgi:hypothetical protein
MSACASRPGDDLRAIAQNGVTHLCAAPIVLTMLIHAPASAKRASAMSSRWHRRRGAAIGRDRGHGGMGFTSRTSTA